MSNLLYNKNNLIGRLYQYFYIYFKTFSARLLRLYSCWSYPYWQWNRLAPSTHYTGISYLGVTNKSLNAFYYACSYAKANYSRFMNVTAGMALKLIPEKLQLHPVFLCIDDTMAPKFGKKFEDVSNLFDHASHNGSDYLNGHCFVSVMLFVPVWNRGKIRYLSIPLGYRMWQKEQSKPELAASMVRKVMPEFKEKKNVIILCDSWYVKKSLVFIANEYGNLDLIGNARSDSVIYDLPPQPTGKRDRPAAHERRLSIQNDFELSDKKLAITIWPYAVCSRISLAGGKS